MCNKPGVIYRNNNVQLLDFSVNAVACRENLTQTNSYGLVKQTPLSINCFVIFSLWIINLNEIFYTCAFESFLYPLRHAPDSELIVSCKYNQGLGQTSNFSWDEPNLVSWRHDWNVRRLAQLSSSEWVCRASNTFYPSEDRLLGQTSIFICDELR